MSVLASRRKESRFEPVVFSLEIHDMLVELMQRQFGVKDLDQLIGKEATTMITEKKKGGRKGGCGK